MKSSLLPVSTTLRGYYFAWGQSRVNEDQAENSDDATFLDDNGSLAETSLERLLRHSSFGSSVL